MKLFLISLLFPLCAFAQNTHIKQYVGTLRWAEVSYDSGHVLQKYKLYVWDDTLRVRPKLPFDSSAQFFANYFATQALNSKLRAKNDSLTAKNKELEHLLYIYAKRIGELMSMQP